MRQLLRYLLILVVLAPIALHAQTTAPADDGRPLMKKVVEFMGGAQNLATVKSVQERLDESQYVNFRLVGAGANYPSEAVVSGGTIRLIEFPDQVQFKLVNSSVSKTLGSSGAFGVNQGRVYDLSTERNEILDDIKRDIINIAQHVDDPKYVFRLTKPNKIGKTLAMQVDIDADGAKTTWAVDPNTGQLLEIWEDYHDSLLAGPVQQTISEIKYKKFGSLNLPARAHVVQEFSHAYSDALDRRLGHVGGGVGSLFYGTGDLALEKVNPAIPPGTFDPPKH